MTAGDKSAAGLGQIHSKSAEILNVRAAVTRDEHRTAAVVQGIGFALGRPALFLLLIAGCLLWMFANLRDIPWWQPWDPYPFTFLATLASAFGPFLTLLVLMYQRRNSHIADVRQELALQVTLHLERQMSVTIRLLRALQESAAPKGAGDEKFLDELLAEVDAGQLLERIRRELDEKQE